MKTLLVKKEVQIIRIVLIINALTFLATLSLLAQETKTFRTNAKTFIHTPRNTDTNARSSDCVQSPFRSIDGTCNNLEDSKTEWGAADIPFSRVMPATYGAPNPLNDMAGQNRLSARAISNIICDQGQDRLSQDNLSSMTFSWGQFLDHDIDLTPEGEEEYYPIVMPEDEPLFTSDIPFHRSAIHEGTGTNSPREQTNLITSWIDASNVYGSEEGRSFWLRTMVDGKLKTSAGNLLPFNTLTGQYDSDIDPNAPSMAGDEGGLAKTFVAGDVRAAEQPGLTSLHTLFMREHNWVCNILRSRGYTNDEQMYQLARKWVGALIQSITYQEFLPAMGIDLDSYDGYNPDVHPDITNLFATAAYRFGHSMVTEELLLRDNDCEAVGDGEVSLIDAFFNPAVIQTNNIDPILKGLSMQRQQEVDIRIIDNLRNFLFAIPGSPVSFGLDLASLNIQRGRDHGLPHYNSVRAHYLGESASNFGQINNFDPVREALQEAYEGDINNIDLWVGLLTERQLQGKSVGPTMHAILKEGFEKLRDGDYYYYEHDPHLFNFLRNIIANTRLSDIIERHTSLNQLSNNVFEANDCNDGGGNGGNGGNDGPGGNGGGIIAIDEDAVKQAIPQVGLESKISTLVDRTLRVYPNPGNGLVQIQLQDENASDYNLQVISGNGALVYKETMTETSGYLNKQFNLTHLAPGIYFIRISTNQHQYIEKIILD